MNILKLAEEARLAFNFDDYPDIWTTHMNVGREEIERFAALVEAAARADEREACANMCMAVPRTGAYFARLIRARGTT